MCVAGMKRKFGKWTNIHWMEIVFGVGGSNEILVFWLPHSIHRLGFRPPLLSIGIAAPADSGFVWCTRIEFRNAIKIKRLLFIEVDGLCFCVRSIWFSINTPSPCLLRFACGVDNYDGRLTGACRRLRRIIAHNKFAMNFKMACAERITRWSLNQLVCNVCPVFCDGNFRISGIKGAWVTQSISHEWVSFSYSLNMEYKRPSSDVFIDAAHTLWRCTLIRLAHRGRNQLIMHWST